MTTTDDLTVAPGHAEQLAAWDGGEGAYWAAHAASFERSLAAYQESFMAAAGIARADHVLDIGCGTGGATLEAAGIAADGLAVGVDLSSAMLQVGRERARTEGVHNVSFEQADAQVHAFPAGSFDVAIGRTSAMFFADKVAALANVARALRPGGRLALLTWQPVHVNEWFLEIATALAAGRDRPSPPPEGPQPFSMTDPDRVRSWLVAAGFGEVEARGVTGPMWFGGDPDEASTFVLGQLDWMLDGLDEDGRSRAIDDLRARIRAHHGPGGVTFGSACWLVTALRTG